MKILKQKEIKNVILIFLGNWLLYFYFANSEFTVHVTLLLISKVL